MQSLLDNLMLFLTKRDTMRNILNKHLTKHYESLHNFFFNWSEEAFYPLLLTEEKNKIQIVTLLGR